MSIKLVDTLEPMASFPIAMAENIDFADGKSLQEKYDSGKLVSSAEAPVKVTDGKISLDTVPITKGGTGVTTQEDINKAFINNLEISNSDVTDGTEFVSSWSSDKGFAETAEGTLNKPYKRQFIKVWNYIKDKISSVLGLTATNYNGTANKVANSLTFGSKTYNGSSAQTITASDLGALTAHQTIKQDGITGATVNRFGTCSTAAATAAKTVSITTGTFLLEAGARVSVKFSNANTADTPTLNVASKGAKNIFHKGAQITTGVNKALLAGVCDFIYDGTQWHLIGNYIDTNTTYSNFVKSGSGAKSGLVPAPSTTAGTTKYLREDGTWQVPPDTNTVYTHPTTSGNKHIPSGGKEGQILRWSSDGTAVWGADSATTATTAYKIRVGRPSSPQDGDVWIE